MSDKWEDEFSKLMGSLFVVSIIISAWLSLKAAELVLRVMVKYPEHRFMWVLLVVWLSSAIVLGLVAYQPHSHPDAAWVFFGLSTTVLLLAAKAVEIYHQDRFERDITKEVVIDDVLHHSWFSI